MKATLTFLKDLYSPLHKKWFKAADKNNSIEIDVDSDGQPIHSFWFGQLKDSPDFFKITLAQEAKAEVKSDIKSPKIKSE